MWDLTSLTRDQTNAPCSGSMDPEITEPTMESPEVFSECQTPEVCGCANLSSHWSDRAWLQQDVPALSL